MRCAEWARAVALDPAGTAPQSDVFILVEHPLPWPSDIAELPVIAAVDRAVRERLGPTRSVRVQALAVDAPSVLRRVIVFALGDGPVRGYGRLEARARPEELVAVAVSLVAAEPPRPERGGVTDVLICTHGSRDACCGSLGTRLWQNAERRGVRVWRTSHTGGHRFAPTAVTFPDGCYWAYLDPVALEGVVDQTLEAEAAAAHLRGCAAFPPSVQVADRAVFAQHGWDWLSCPRFGATRNDERVELCFETRDQVRGGYDVCVHIERKVPMPTCGAPPAEGGKTQAEWGITRVQSWA